MFEQILSTNLINFIIVILTLRWIAKKARLGELLQKMADDVQLSVENSAKRKDEAIKEYEAIKTATKDTPKLQEEILANAKSNAQNLKEKIEAKTSAQVEEMNCSVGKIYEKQLDKIKKATTAQIYSACVEIAKNQVLKRLDKNTHKKLIDNSIEEIKKI